MWPVECSKDGLDRVPSIGTGANGVVVPSLMEMGLD